MPYVPAPVIEKLCALKVKMELKDQKILLITFVLVNAIVLIPLTLLGTSMLILGPPTELGAFLLIFGCVLGLISISIGIYSSFKFPNVSKLSAANFCIGYALLISVGFIISFGLPLLVSLASFSICGIIILRQFHART